MYMVRVALVVVVMIISNPVLSQGFPANYPAPATSTSCLGCINLSSSPTSPADVIATFRLTPSAGGVNGLSYNQYGYLSLNTFASASDVSALSSQFQSQIASFRSEVRSKLANGVALAAAMDIQAPAAGTSNRIGGQVTNFDGRAAAAINFAHQHGHFDVGFAAGFASGSAMGKASLGLSW